MNTLAEFRTWIRAYLGDAAGARYTDSIVDQALRVALEELSHSIPQHCSQYHVVIVAGNDQVIDNVTHWLDVLEVYHPWTDDSNGVKVPFYATFDGYNMDLRFPTVTPQVDEVLWIKYTCKQIILNLDSETRTSFSPSFNSLLVQGAAGLSALSRASTVMEVPSKRLADAVNLEKWGRKEHDAFLRTCLKLKFALAGHADPLPSSGFALDSYDSGGDP